MIRYCPRFLPFDGHSRNVKKEKEVAGDQRAINIVREGKRRVESNSIPRHVILKTFVYHSKQVLRTLIH